MSLAPASATVYVTGVKVGNWAKYAIIGGWSAYNTTVTMPQFVTDAKNTEWIRINVTKVSYTTVTLLVTTLFKDGSKRLSTNIGDVKTGSGNLSLQVVAAYLDQGEKVSESEGALTINKTTLKTYANALRNVNYAYKEEYAQKGEIGVEQVLYEFRWDKTSGIIVGMSFVNLFESQDFKTIASTILEIKETNIWQPEVSSGLSLEWIVVAASVVAIAITLVAFLAIRGMKRGNKRRRSRMPRRSHQLGLRVHQRG